MESHNRRSPSPPRQTVRPLSHGARNRCFGCGQHNKTGLRLKFFVDQEQNVQCRVKLPHRFEGPRNHAHGGVIATLLDEAMSKANRVFDILAMTRHMEIEYLKPVPLGAPLTLAGRHIRAEGRKHYCEAALSNENGAVLASASALFIAVDPELLRKTLPVRS